MIPKVRHPVGAVEGCGPQVRELGLRGAGNHDQIANIRWITEKAREFQRNIYFWFIGYAKAFDCVDSGGG